MHLELVVPALLPAQEPAANPVPMRVPALETLLARARRTDGQSATLETWLCRAFGLGDPPSVPAGALTALAYGLEPGTNSWLRADPVHLRADRDRVLLMPGQGLSVTATEAQGLAAALTPLLDGKFVLHAVNPGQWCLQIPGLAQAEIGATAPIDLAGADIDPHLPPKQWHLLLTEIQMALYEHPVNTAREQRGDPVINSLWLWGTGSAPATAKAAWHSVSATDAVAAGLARSAALRHREPGGGADEWLARAPE